MEQQERPVEVLSFQQELAVLCIGWFSACCSIAGSSCILYLLYQKGSRRHENVFRLDTLSRLMMAMSACDIFHSTSFLGQGFLLPRDSSPRAFAHGNDATCTFMGFCVQFGLSVAFYNGMISFYYLCTVRHGMSARQVAQQYEPYMHLIALGFPLTTAILGVAINAFHEIFAGPGCWIADFPQGCDGNPDLTCRAFLVGYLFAGGPVGFVFVCIMVNFFRIYQHVRRVLSRGARRSFDSENQTNRIDQVATQSYLYVLVFCLTFACAFLTQSMEAGTPDETWNERDIFPWIVLNQMFFPLQGFLNFFIYLRPRYIAVRSFHLQQTRWWAFCEALRREAHNDVAVAGHEARQRRRRRNKPTPVVRSDPSRISPAPSLQPELNSSSDNPRAPASSSSSPNNHLKTSGNSIVSSASSVPGPCATKVTEQDSQGEQNS